METAHTFIFVSNAKKPPKSFRVPPEAAGEERFLRRTGWRVIGSVREKKARRADWNLKKAPGIFSLIAFPPLPNGAGWPSRSSKNIFVRIFPTDKIERPQKIISPVLDDQVFEAARKISWSRSWAEKLGLLEKPFPSEKEATYIFNSLAYIAKGKDIVRMADYDVAVKSGNLEYEEALLDFVLSA